MLLSLLIIVLHTVVFHWAFMRLWRSWPAPRPADISRLTPDEWRKCAIRSDRLFNWIALATFPLALAGWLYLCWLLKSYLAESQPESNFLLVADFTPHIFSAMIAAYCLAGLVGMGLWRLLLGSQSADHLACGKAHFGFDALTFLYVVNVWALPLCVEWDLHWLGCHARFEEKTVAISGFWSLGERHYSYEDISAIYRVQNFKRPREAVVGPPAEYAILFQDGIHWTTADGHRYPQKQDQALIEFVARKSGKPIVLVDSLWFLVWGEKGL